MLSTDILKKVRQIELRTRRVVDDLLSGQYRSQFKGYGVQFSDHRVYTPGDDVRHIDWKVSARARETVIKKFEEERELTVLLCIDGSGSQAFGSINRFKSEAAAEVAGMLAFAASRVGDKVGAIFFSGTIDKIIRPKKGRSHVLRIIRDVLTFQPKSGGTALGDALDSAGHLLKHLGVVFVISDFLTEGFDKQLKRLSRRHDVIAVSVRDDRESMVPEMGHVLLSDPETGAEVWVNTQGYAFRAWVKRQAQEVVLGLEGVLKSSRVERIQIIPHRDVADPVIEFFRKRRK